MWDQITVEDNDFSWLATALQNDTAVAGTDGSYYSDMAPQISGAGWIIYCFQICKLLVPWRVIRGLLALHIFLHSIKKCFDTIASSPTHIWCENLGALTAVKRHRKKISTGTMTQANISWVLQAVRRNNISTHQYFHVPTHQDNINIIVWDCLSLQAQLNCICDSSCPTLIRQTQVATIFPVASNKQQM